MKEIQDSPMIDHVCWGDIELVDGKHFKDAVLFPGGAHSWDWSQTGTQHSPGIKIADVMELIEHDADILILSEGMAGSLHVAPETIKMLQDKGVKVYIRKTEKAVRIYNQLAKRHRHVGALLHSTC